MKTGRSLLVVFLLCAMVAAGALSYRHWPDLRKRFTKAPANTSPPESLSSSPPFSTKEPERYQATRIISSVENKDGPVTISKTLIARDGDKRREEYEPGTNQTTIYLEIPEGRFLLSPAKRWYTDLGLDSGNLDAFSSESKADGGAVPPVIPDFSPERLLNEALLVSYEKLGSETINERAATKYRVTANDATKGSNAGSVTLIWIDDSLGLPVRSETSSTTGEHPATLTVELRDLRDTVEARIFGIPGDYEKVDYRRFFAEIPPTASARGRDRSATEKP